MITKKILFGNIGKFTYIATLKIDKEYDSEKDVALWLKQENLMQTILTSDSYAVLYPNNAHISAIAINNQFQKIKLIVCKVKSK